MKIVVTVLLIFTIFSDFTSSSFFEEDLGLCESKCIGSDSHTQNDEHGHSEGDEHHCHQGHTHTSIFEKALIVTFHYKNEFTLSFLAFQVGNPNKYLHDIVRPPIA